jgi:hypothetical protein
MVRPISTDSSFLIFSSIFEKSIHITTQNMSPHNTIHKNERKPNPILAHVNSPLRIIHKMIKKNASAVPSLNILSHSNISASLRGAPTDLKIDSTATGSVAEIIHPNNKQTKKGIFKPSKGKIKYSPHATINAEIKSPNTAKLAIDFQFAKSCL